MWNDIEKGFQIAFETAWNAYKSGSTPIGACILNENGDLVAVGQNQIHAQGDGLLSFHQLAHAEANAIFKISEEYEPNQHPNIRKYTLYAIMEPCPFCFGAIVMGSIRHLKFAARDGIAGATALNESIDYIKSKRISVEGPFEDIEFVQIAIQTCFKISKYRNAERVISSWSKYCPNGVDVGKRFFDSGELRDLIEQDAEASTVFDYVLSCRYEA